MTQRDIPIEDAIRRPSCPVIVHPRLPARLVRTGAPRFLVTPLPRRFLLTLVAAFCSFTVAGQVLPDGGPLADYLAVDAILAGVPLNDAIDRSATERREAISACGAAEVVQDSWRACAFTSLFQNQVTEATTDIEHNTLSFALVTGAGSCAARVSMALAVTDELGSPLDAVIFRDHVVLGLRGTKGVYFETLEGGRQIGDLDLRRHKMPPSGKPIRVGAEGFLPYYLDNLAARLAEAGRRDDAERALKQGLSLAPKAGRLHYNYGTLLLDSERFEEADRHLRLAIRYGWDDADAWVNRGVALWKLGKMTKAADCFEAALKKDPKNSRALSNREAMRHTSSRTAQRQRFRGEHSPSPRTTGGRIRNRR